MCPQFSASYYSATDTASYCASPGAALSCKTDGCSFLLLNQYFDTCDWLSRTAQVWVICCFIPASSDPCELLARSVSRERMWRHNSYQGEKTFKKKKRFSYFFFFFFILGRVDLPPSSVVIRHPLHLQLNMVHQPPTLTSFSILLLNRNVSSITRRREREEANEASAYVIVAALIHRPNNGPSL